MPLVVQPTPKEHVYQCAEVQLAAFAHDPMVPNLMKGIPHEEQVRFFAESLAKDLEGAEVRNLEVVDTETGKPVAFAQWKYPAPKSVKKHTGLETMKFPEGANMPLVQAVFEAYGRISKTYYDSETMYFLNYMQVDPAYQRQGLGQRLMKQALQDADRDGAQAFLCASDAGKRLYVKYGFKTLEEVKLDFVHLGATALRKTTAMLREPQATQKED